MEPEVHGRHYGPFEELLLVAGRRHCKIDFAFKATGGREKATGDDVGPPDKSRHYGNEQIETIEKSQKDNRVALVQQQRSEWHSPDGGPESSTVGRPVRHQL